MFSNFGNPRAINVIAARILIGRGPNIENDNRPQNLIKAECDSSAKPKSNV
jgi:hypothetical protein